jgi:hypothetical protein
VLLELNDGEVVLATNGIVVVLATTGIVVALAEAVDASGMYVVELRYQPRTWLEVELTVAKAEAVKLSKVVVAWLKLVVKFDNQLVVILARGAEVMLAGVAVELSPAE